MRRFARVPSGLVLAVLSLALAGCGAAEPRVDADSAVRRASEQTARERSARFEIRYVTREGVAAFDGTCDGTVSYAEKRYRVVCNQRRAGADADAFELEVVSVDGVDYVRFEGDVPVAVHPTKRWLRVGRDDGNDPFRVFDPVALLELLRSATKKTEHLGAAEVRGVATEHFRLTIDREKAQLFTGDEDGPEAVPVDVWIDGEGVIRRMRAEHAAGQPATIEFFDFGAQVEIEAPPPDDVAETGAVGADYAESAPCGGGEPAPLTENAVRSELGERGIALVKMPNGCSGGVAVTLTNVLFDRRDDVGEAQRDAPPPDGLVMCLLRRGQPGAGGSTLRKHEDRGATVFTLANVECSLYPQGARPPDELRRLEAALRALERTLR